jgi:hypothetical protein
VQKKPAISARILIKANRLPAVRFFELLIGKAFI